MDTTLTAYKYDANHSGMEVTLQSHYLGSLLGMEKRFFFLLLRELFVSRTICHLTKAFISQSVSPGDDGEPNI